MYYFWRWSRCSLFEPNNEGLGLQDEYLRSDGIGRDFLRIEAGGSIMPPTIKTVEENSNILSIKKEKLFLNMLFLIWQMLQKKC